MAINRRTVFALILGCSVAIDMISTHLMIASGYREATGLIVLMLDVSQWLLYVWVILWFGLAYFLYPLMERLKVTTHFETICLWYGFISIMAGVGNFYLYFKYVVPFA